MTGVRRSGKTTILVQFIHRLIEGACVKSSQTMYVNLEDPRLPIQDGAGLLDALVTAHQAFVDSAGLRYLILDEVQRIPGWERWVGIQQELRPDLAIIVSGSSAELLSKELATLLTGRHLDPQVFFLDFSEYPLFHGIDPDDALADAGRIKSLASEYISESTFPTAVLTPDPDLFHEFYTQKSGAYGWLNGVRPLYHLPHPRARFPL